MDFPSRSRPMTTRQHSGLVILALGLGLAFSACTQRLPPPPKPYLAFVANQGSGTVAVLNLATFRVIASIAVAAPTELTRRPGTREIWAAGASGEISVIRFPELRVTATLRLGHSASDLFFSPDGARFYAINRSTGDVVFGDGEQGQLPHPDGSIRRAVYRYGGGALTPGGRTLVLADAARNRLVFVDTTSRERVGSVDVGQQPGSLALVPDASKVFVADTGEEAVSVADVPRRQLLSNLEIGTRPGALVLKPDGGELFVLAREGGVMTIVDAFHDDVEQTFPVGEEPVAGVFRRDSSALYVANGGDGSVTAIDAQNRVVLNSTHVGGAPRALALTPDERFVVVACPDDGSIAVLKADPSRLTTRDSALVTTIPTGLEPVDVIVPGWQTVSH